MRTRSVWRVSLVHFPRKWKYSDSQNSLDLAANLSGKILQSRAELNPTPSFNLKPWTEKPLRWFKFSHGCASLILFALEWEWILICIHRLTAYQHNTRSLAWFKWDVCCRYATSLKEIRLFFIFWGRLFHVLPKKCWWDLSNRVTLSWWLTSWSPSEISWKSEIIYPCF